MAVKKVAAKKQIAKRKKTPTKTTPKKTAANDSKTRDKRETDFLLFVEYMALPTVMRMDVFKNPETQEGIETQKEFGIAYGIPDSRLSEWKRDKRYQDLVSAARRQYFRGELGDAIQAVMTNVLVNPKGADLKVLLEYAGEVQRDDPGGEVSEQLGAILGKLNKMIPW